MVLPQKLQVQALDVEKGLKKHSPSPDSPSKRKRAPTAEDTRAGESLLGGSNKVDNQAAPVSTGRFKALGHLVLAMKRFQAGLNPTVDFGKKREEVEPPVAVSTKDTRIKSSRPAAAPAASSPPHAKMAKTYSTRGHKTAYLFTNLPAPEN
ncbi:hypothetical protein WJX72_011955 [[Myrmecia] bisecta]|uniref:Uncharacterized protein n=1 Tax=[Myrmecia] bisecta TaxID=41462 RepID=A0AAW1Q4X1_9CHLO